MRSRWRLSRPPACSVSFLWFRQKYLQLLISNDLIIPCLDVFFFIFLGVHRASRISEFYRFHQVYKQRWPLLSILPPSRCHTDETARVLDAVSRIFEVLRFFSVPFLPVLQFGEFLLYWLRVGHPFFLWCRI